MQGRNGGVGESQRYRTGENQNSSSSKTNYSTTTESIIGTWIDGSNIYGKVIDLGYNYEIKTSATSISSNLLPTDISTPIKACFYIIDTDNNVKTTNPCEFNRDKDNFECRPIAYWGGTATRHVYLYIEYTKQ